MVLDVINSALPILTVLGQVILGLFVLGGIIVAVSSSSLSQRLKDIWDSLIPYSGYIAFLSAALATSGSLFYSQIMGYDPCLLCWWQRIFMYPLVLLTPIALYFRDKYIVRYVVPMSVIGGGIAIAHYIQQLTQVAMCGGTTSCAVKYTFHYGYITIPVMALTSFALTIVFISNWARDTV